MNVFYSSQKRLWYIEVISDLLFSHLEITPGAVEKGEDRGLRDLLKTVTTCVALIPLSLINFHFGIRKMVNLNLRRRKMLKPWV